MAEEKDVNICILGDEGVGKTALIYSYATDEFLQDYTSTVFDHYESEIDLSTENLNNKVDLNFKPPITAKIHFWDVSAKEKDESIRKYCVEKCDGFLVAFSMTDRNTFDNAIDKWVPYIKKFCKPSTKLTGKAEDQSPSPQKDKHSASKNKQLKDDAIEEQSDEDSNDNDDDHKSKSKKEKQDSQDSENSGSQSYESRNSKNEFKVSDEKWNIALVGTKFDLLINEKYVNDLK